MSDVPTVSDLGSALVQRWRLVLAVTLAGGLLGLAYGLITPSTYTAKAVLIVMAGPANQDGYYQAAQFAEKRAATYPALIGSPEVLDRTRTDLGLDMSQAGLRRVVTASNPTDTPLVEVSATSTDASEARDIADSAADHLADYAIELEENGSRITTVTIQKAVPATEPLSPSSPSPVLLLALGVLAGGALGAITALLMRTWRGPVRPRLAADAGYGEVPGTDHPAPATATRTLSVPVTPGMGPRTGDGDPLEPAATDGPTADDDLVAEPVAPVPQASAEVDPDAGDDTTTEVAEDEQTPVTDDEQTPATDAEPAAPQTPAADNGVGRGAGLVALESSRPATSPSARRRGPRGARRPTTTAGTAYATDADADPRQEARFLGRIIDNKRHAARNG